MANEFEKNSVLTETSRYVSGGTTEVNSKALEWWERTVFPVNSDDNIYVVETRFVGRLDLIAATYYNEPRYWWVIAQYNNILDAYSEVIEGVILYIPTVTRLRSLLQGGIGGVSSTREVPVSVLPIV